MDPVMDRQRTRKWDTSSSNPTPSRSPLRQLGHVLGYEQERLDQSLLWRMLLIVRHFVHVLFRPVSWIQNFRGDRVRIRVDSKWPLITGSFSLRAGREPTAPLTLRYGRRSVTHRLRDVQVGDAVPDKDRTTHRFEINYPLEFGVFDISKVRLTSGSVKSDFKKSMKRNPSPKRGLVNPSEIAGYSIKHTVSRVPTSDLPSNLGDVAIMSLFTGGTRSLQGSIHLMRELKRNGYFLIVVDTSDSPVGSSTSGEEVQELVDLYVHRANEGWDFASWFSVLLVHPEIVQRAERLLLTNDSNYGPIRPLSDVIERGRSLQAGVWGITDSWAINYHLQSYFMEFDTQTLRSGVLEKFISAYPFPTKKDDVVIEGELGLTKHLKSHGVSIRALVPYEEVTARYTENFPNLTKTILDRPENKIQVDLGRTEDIYDLAFALDIMDSIRTSIPLDPTLHLWEALLQSGSPFIKRKLVLTREGGFTGVENLPSIVSDPEIMDIIRAEAPERFIGSNI